MSPSLSWKFTEKEFTKQVKVVKCIQAITLNLPLLLCGFASLREISMSDFRSLLKSDLASPKVAKPQSRFERFLLCTDFARGIRQANSIFILPPSRLPDGKKASRVLMFYLGLQTRCSVPPAFCAAASSQRRGKISRPLRTRPVRVSRVVKHPSKRVPLRKMNNAGCIKSLVCFSNVLWIYFFPHVLF
jgi:hypothetical protein